MSDATPPVPGVSASTPSVARINNYFAGGKDNFAIDREIAEKVLTLAPEAKDIGTHVQEFRQRVVAHLVKAGVRQFLQVGAWLPVQRNVHQIAQELAPESRAVYVADDPVALNHARALLATNERVGVAEGVILQPDKIVEHPVTRQLIDFSQPVMVLLFGMLQYIPDDFGAYESVAALCDRLAPGSYVAITHAVFDTRPDIAEAVADIYRDALKRPTGGPRTMAEARRFFDGLELIEPGFVYVRQWRPETPVSDAEAVKHWVAAGVGRKP
ncbi:SAM-dependent methyltransferase [Nonomuraea sp. MCN248]|uniref:SAM-dependent methyltransferase n=1 Tax=Nonomuraea corallina TaxID=2989783 RepID=A0ABT4S588_9ACTN|nr:SAM-dependent methyltransferase [Nonomuraea corallina]MDA0632305.1 SAM-dependent methyltransferase [Nonomuraea corallina]